jgi:hypothetical protein
LLLWRAQKAEQVSVRSHTTVTNPTQSPVLQAQFELEAASDLEPHSAPTNRSRLQGRVTTQEGYPVGGVSLELRSGDNLLQQTKSDVMGRFEWKELLVGIYELRALPPRGYEAVLRRIDLRESDQNEEIVLATTRHVWVRIVDEQGRAFRGFKDGSTPAPKLRLRASSTLRQMTAAALALHKLCGGDAPPWDIPFIASAEAGELRDVPPSREGVWGAFQPRQNGIMTVYLLCGEWVLDQRTWAPGSDELVFQIPDDCMRARSGAVIVQLVDAVTGSALIRPQVSLLPVGSGTFVEERVGDELGHQRWEQVLAGEYVLTVAHHGVIAAQVPLVVAAGATKDLGTLRISQEPPAVGALRWPGLPDDARIRVVPIDLQNPEMSFPEIVKPGMDGQIRFRRGADGARVNPFGDQWCGDIVEFSAAELAGSTTSAAALVLRRVDVQVSVQSDHAWGWRLSQASELLLQGGVSQAKSIVLFVGPGAWLLEVLQPDGRWNQHAIPSGSADTRIKD